jgi:UPF0755 protein
MPDGPDWHDPFAEDEEARERERRRAEREARRHGTQASLGDKVSEQQAEQARAAESPVPTPTPTPPPDPAAPAPPSEPPPAPPAPGSEPPADPPTEVAPSRPVTGEHRAPAPSHHPPPTPDPGFEWTDSPRRAPAHHHEGPSSRELWIRRVFGVGAVIALVLVVGWGAKQVLDLLGGDDEPVAKGPATLKTGEIVIVEGRDRRQIADEVKKQVKGDYLDATKKAPKGFPIDKYAPEGVENLEGFLFPATYEVEKDVTANQLVDLQLQAFQDNIKGVDMSYAESKNLTVYDVLKIASIIEREIAVPEERKQAAAVVYNRLAAGDTLGMDATIRFGLQNYDEQLTESELEDPNNPYNTRVIPGLPPTPIGNPGLASIEAAAKPAKTDAYYFVIKPGTCNEHTFVETSEEFAQAEAEYQEALAAEGGSPTDC